MDVLILESTENTPGIILDHNKNFLEFIGESRPEDVKKFFTPIFDWLDTYKNHLYFLADKSGSTINVDCNFKMEYFNSSSAKYILDLFMKLGEINKGNSNVNVNVNWHYNEMDEDMKDAGEEFEKLTGLKFNLVAFA
jgi:hypothetical protein